MPPEDNPLVMLRGAGPQAGSLDEAYQALYGLTGIPDIQGSLSAAGRGEYLQALGQGAAGLSEMLPPLKPEAIALAGIIGGAKALTASSRGKMIARGFEALGRTPEQGFAASGWFKGVDGQWRHIISDEDAKVGPGVKVRPGDPEALMRQNQQDYYSLSFEDKNKLPDVLDHPELYKAYPDLKEVNVQPMSIVDIVSGVKAWTTVDGSAVGIAPNGKEDFFSSLLHEVQHLIQQKEGFAVGGNYSQFLPKEFDQNYMTLRRQWTNEIEPEIEAAGGSKSLIRSHLSYVHRGQDSHEDMAANFQGLPPDLQQKAFDVSKNLFNMEEAQRGASENYENLAGEVEARTVQEQFSQRDWSRMPSQMEGYVPKEKQIIRFQGPVAPRLEPVEHDPFSGSP